MLPDEVVLSIVSEADAVLARQRVRAMALEMGFGSFDQVALSAAAWEVARNIVQYAQSGQVSIRGVESGGRRGLQLVARDQGPGIANIARALKHDRAGVQSAGLGLAGAKRLVDEFEIDSEPGKGTVVTIRKWMKAAPHQVNVTEGRGHG